MEYCVLTKEDLYSAKECISLGGGGVCPIVAVDDNKIGNGTVGPIFRALRDALQEEMNEFLIDEVPYEDYNNTSLSSTQKSTTEDKDVTLTNLTYAIGGLVLGLLVGKKLL